MSVVSTIKLLYNITGHAHSYYANAVNVLLSVTKK